MALLQGQTGAPAGAAAAGTTVPLRTGTLNDTIVSELHGRYYETTKSKSLFIASSPSASATSVGIIASASVYTGLALYNPLANGYNLVVTKVGLSFPVTPVASIAYGLVIGGVVSAATLTTAATTRNLFIGGAAPTATAMQVWTPTFSTAATIAHVLGTVGTGALTTFGNLPGVIDLEGGLIITPGYFVEIYTSTAANTGGFLGSITWEEVPV